MQMWPKILEQLPKRLLMTLKLVVSDKRASIYLSVCLQDYAIAYWGAYIAFRVVTGKTKRNTNSFLF